MLAAIARADRLRVLRAEVLLVALAILDRRRRRLVRRKLSDVVAVRVARPLEALALIAAAGASGAVRSGVGAEVAGDILPAPSLWVTESEMPVICGGDSAMLNSPSGPAAPVARTVPPESRTVIVAPGSPLPLINVPSGDTDASGAGGVTRSGALASVDGETLPAASLCTTLSASPLVWAVRSVAL